EVNNIGIRVGWANGAEADTYGVFVSGLASERSTIGIELFNCQGGYIANNSLYIGMGYAGFVPITAGSWSSGTATLTSNRHNLISSPYVIAVNGLPAAWQPAGFTGLLKVTQVDTNRFSYPLPSDPGTFTGTVRWNYPGEFAVRCRKVYETVIANTHRSDFYSKASFDLDYADAPGGSPGVDYRNSMFIGVNGSMGWNLPTDRSKLAGWQFINTYGTAAPV